VVSIMSGFSRLVSDDVDVTLILWLNLLGTFVFGISGGLAAVRARLDVFAVFVLAGVVGLAGGIVRDLLIGVPPATFRDWRYRWSGASAACSSSTRSGSPCSASPAPARRWD
jgi:uncharacterized membrane protein YeiH